MEIVIILVLILLNGILSMSEMALVSARRTKLETDAKKGSRTAGAALKLSGEPDRFLSTVQIGITLIGILTGLYSGEKFATDFAKLIAKSDFLAPYSVGLAKTTIVIVVTYLTLVFGELLPKRLGLSRPEKVSKAVARPMTVLSKICAPIVWLLSKSTSLMVKLFGIKSDDSGKVTEEEIKAIVKEGLIVGEVQEVEQEIVERVFSLGDRDVDSIMTHRSDLVWLDARDDEAAIRAKIEADMHDVYPVSDGKPGELAGVVFLKDLFNNVGSPGFSLRSIIRPAQCLSENQSVYDSLALFKKENVKYGFVIDEFGEVQGIVTLKDMLEALVGEVLEEGEQHEIMKRDDGSWLVEGQYSFYNFLEYFDMEELYPDNDHNTVSGLILDELERIPAVGEKMSWNRFDFEVVDMDGARIDKILVTLRNGKNKK